jgi:hypothetical protein
MLNYLETHLASIYSASVRVLYILQKIRCFMREQKHIDVKYHYVREVIADGILKVPKISTYDNPADMITKHVPVTKFELCSSLVGITV